MIRALDGLLFVEMQFRGRDWDDWKESIATRLRNLGISAGSLPSWTLSVTQASSVSAYVSTWVYNCLNWLNKPYGGYILSLGAVALYMVIIVLVTMSKIYI